MFKYLASILNMCFFLKFMSQQSILGFVINFLNDSFFSDYVYNYLVTKMTM
jgi:hypothetical protein